MVAVLRDAIEASTPVTALTCSLCGATGPQVRLVIDPRSPAVAMCFTTDPDVIDACGDQRAGSYRGEAMKVYLAARYSRNAEMRGVRDVLQGLGYKVTSRWIDQHGGNLLESIVAEKLNADPAGARTTPWSTWTT